MKKKLMCKTEIMRSRQSPDRKKAAPKNIFISFLRPWVVNQVTSECPSEGGQTAFCAQDKISKVNIFIYRISFDKGRKGRMVNIINITNKRIISL